MNRYDQILAKMKHAVDNPAKMLKEYTKSGKKAIGCMYYTPEELIHAAGMIPFGVWGGDTEISSAKTYFPSFICSILQTSLELGIRGVYDDLSAMIIPANCDPLRTMGQNWKVAVPQVEFISLVHPVNRKTEAGLNFLMTEYLSVKKALERISGNVITPEALDKSISIYNHYRKTMRAFTKVAADYPDIITPSVRHMVIKASFFIEKEEFTGLLEDLIDDLKQHEKEKWKGKKILVSGILLDSPDILKIIEENHIAVVADDLAQETRQFRSDVPVKGGTALERLVKYWSEMEGCSLLYDPDKKRGDMIIHDVKEAGADGVLFLMMKFCDPEEFDYPVIKKQLEEAHIPQVYIEFEQNAVNDEQARTRIQAFSEMVNA